jgi:hypothetical protein
MKSLFDVAVYNEVVIRITSLQPSSSRQWGSMTAPQMLAHCSAWIEMAEGSTSQRHSALGRLFGKMAKKSILGPEPIRRNMPTDKHLVIPEERNFAAEQERLINLVKQFSEGGPERCTKHPHSFFGYMTPDEWAAMGYKHLDHHLRQFGA